MKNHKCDLCGKAFHVPSLLKRHIESVHEGIRHNCEFCDKSFCQLATLKVHMKTNHTEEITNYECQHCSKEFCIESGLADHILTVHCSNDNKTDNEKILIDLVEKSQLNNVSKNSHNRTIIWKEITEKFNEISANELDSKAVKKKWENYLYKLSQKKSNDEKIFLKKSKTSNCDKTLMEHKCNFCAKIFTKKVILTNHIKKFHQEPKIQCHICSETFRKKSDFETHSIEVHSILNMYRCQFCCKEYDKKARPYSIP